MNGSLREAWEYLDTDVWKPLAGFASADAAAPPDLFGDLYALASDYLALRPPDVDLAAARSEPNLGREYFLTLIGTDFMNESSIVEFLEETRNVIADYEIPGYEDYYHRLLKKVLARYNLRYRLEDPFTLRYLLPGSFTNLYSEVIRLSGENQHLGSLLTDFERAFDRYVRTADLTDLKTCIGKASMFAEGLASNTLGIPESHNTMGRLCDQLSDWPHNRVKDALKQLYGFCSDYPGIRHSGHPTNALRDLAARDLTVACMLIIGFSSYLSPDIDEKFVLGV